MTRIKCTGINLQMHMSIYAAALIMLPQKKRHSAIYKYIYAYSDLEFKYIYSYIFVNKINTHKIIV